MRTYGYPAVFEPGDEGGIVVTFPDVPGAVSQGDDAADARAMAADALGIMLVETLARNEALPAPSSPRAPRGAEIVIVTPDPDLAAKIAVLEAFRDAGVSKTELALRLGKDEREVRRILDPDHPTTMPALAAALAALGQRLVVGVEAA